MATLAGERRKFEITVTKDAAAGDTRQIAAQGASVALYKEGADNLSSVSLVAGPPATTLNVRDVGDIKVGDTLKIWQGTDFSVATLTVTEVTNQTSIKITADQSVTLVGTERLVIQPEVTVYANDRTDATLANPLTADAKGFTYGYPSFSNVDVHISGSGLISQLKTDTGQPVRTVYNVTEHGVKGDGVTDDATAINNLIKKAIRSGSRFRTLYFPGGATYLIGSRIELDGNIAATSDMAFMGGPGATIKLSGSSANSMFATPASGAQKTNYLIDGFTFTAPDNAGTLRAIDFHPTTTAGVISGVTIRNCTFNALHGTSYAISAGLTTSTTGHVQDLQVYDNRFQDVVGGSSAVYMAHAKQVIIRDNWFNQCQGCVWAYNESAAYETRDITIQNNHIASCTGYAIRVYTKADFVPVATHRGYHITGNKIDVGTTTNTYYGIQVWNVMDVNITDNSIYLADYHAIQLSGVSEYEVTGNVIVSPNSAGIYMSNTPTSVCARGIIAKNVVIDTGATAAIYLNGVLETQVVNNLIKTYVSDAIELINTAGTPADVSIIGNHIMGAVSGSSINISAAAATRVTVVSNVLDANITDTNNLAVIIGNRQGATSETQWANAVFTYTNAMMKWCKGSLVYSTPAITLSENGNYFEINQAGSYTVSSITGLQAGTYIAIKNIHAAGVGTFTTAGNIRFQTGVPDFELRPSDVLFLVSDGTNWVTPKQEAFWRYSLAYSGIPYIEARNPLATNYTGGPATNDAGLILMGSIANPGGGDRSAAGIKSLPVYTGSAATTHRFIHLTPPTGGGGVTGNASYVFEFDQAVPGAGVAGHYVDGSSTKTTPGGVDAWMKIWTGTPRVAYYIPMYLSKTA